MPPGSMHVPVHLVPSTAPSGAQGTGAMGCQDAWGSRGDGNEGMEMFVSGSAGAETPQLASHPGIGASAALIWLQGPFHPEHPDPHGHPPGRWVSGCGERTKHGSLTFLEAEFVNHWVPAAHCSTGRTETAAPREVQGPPREDPF